MKGLVIWAHSTCRSMIHLYDEIKNIGEFPVKIALWHHAGFAVENHRAITGFVANECQNLPLTPVGEDYQKGVAILDECRGWNHLFGLYQTSWTFRRLCIEASRRGEHVGIISEAPCNMETGLRRIAKMVYMRMALPIKVKKVVHCADFIANMSGDCSKTLKWLGWADEKIIPFGYFPPPLEKSELILRQSNRPFRILYTGIMSRYRGADVLMRALVLLKMWGINFCATFTQRGPLLEDLKRMAVKYGLPVDFPGLVPLSELVRLYETCSVFVGPGPDEPWAMRLNDAVQCGAPIVVSSGTGAKQIVNRYACGCTFERNDHVDLANKLKRLASDEKYYQWCAHNAIEAAPEITPKKMARRLIEEVRSRVQGWH